jgi:hypothetical protein
MDGPALKIYYIDFEALQIFLLPFALSIHEKLTNSIQIYNDDGDDDDDNG